MAILLTGAAGFIGFHAALCLLQKGHKVIGVDNINDYYPVALKHARLQELEKFENFSFFKMDICQHDELLAICKRENVEKILHLAAQAGVRYSLENPFAYTKSNIEGFVSIIEIARKLPNLKSFVYASSSSVYGNSSTIPFSEDQAVDSPASLYAATKRANELMAQTYFNLYQLPSVGLRFFTVYGPWGRPDMAPFKFAQAIMNEQKIDVYNFGKMRRDFTYIDDIISGTIAALELPISEPKIYNLGNNQSQDLMHFIKVMEGAIGKSAIIEFKPLQKGEAIETYANIERAKADLAFNPQTSIEIGIPIFINWLKNFNIL